MVLYGSFLEDVSEKCRLLASAAQFVSLFIFRPQNVANAAKAEENELKPLCVTEVLCKFSLCKFSLTVLTALKNASRMLLTL
jgi:hypothetical protein